MVLPDKKHFLLNISLKSLRKKALEVCPFLKNSRKDTGIIIINGCTTASCCGNFAKEKRYFFHIQPG